MASLVITGDDFGLNSAVNETVERYHQAGVLTQASLMVHEAKVDEALRIARRNPKLCVGLHLTLCCGRAGSRSRLTHGDPPEFLPSPALAGLKYAAIPGLREALHSEIETQFEHFKALELPPTYWDGHTHLHLHPKLLDLTLPIAVEHGFKAVRLVQEKGFGALPLIFRLLSRAAKPKLTAHGVRFCEQTFGLRDTGRITTRRFARYLASLPTKALSEIYFHPGAEPEELDTDLLREMIALRAIRLTRFSAPE